MFRISAILAASSLVAVSAADTVLLSSDNDLYRITNGVQESFHTSVDIRAMQGNPATGEVMALADAGTPGAPATLYSMGNVEVGTPTLTPVSSLSRLYGSFSRVGDFYYAFAQGQLFRIDVSSPASPVETLIGNTGILGTAATAYDPDTGTFYMASSDTGRLYRVNIATAALQTVGPLGTAVLDLGGEWYNGQLYMAIQNSATDQLELGRVNVNNGAFTRDLTIAAGAVSRATALAIIPEPTSLLPLMVLAMAARRRAYGR